MKIDEWCQLHDITKASYYWGLRKVREAYLKIADQTQTFVEVSSSAIHPVNMGHQSIGSLPCLELEQTHLGDHRVGICLISKYTFENAQGCSMMVLDSNETREISPSMRRSS